jgi:hypothetical protein
MPSLPNKALLWRRDILPVSGWDRRYFSKLVSEGVLIPVHFCYAKHKDGTFKLKDGKRIPLDRARFRRADVARLLEI